MAEAKDTREISEEDTKAILAQIVALKKIEGLHLDLMGSWIWISGDTKPVKEDLKALGCWWASKKKCWYWHLPQDSRKFKHKPLSMEDIEKKYGKKAI